jgi:hypothetical protein
MCCGVVVVVLIVTVTGGAARAFRVLTDDVTYHTKKVSRKKKNPVSAYIFHDP